MGILTDFLLPVATQFVSAKYGGALPGVSIADIAGYSPGGGFTLPTTPVFQEEGILGIPGGDFIVNPPTQCGTASPVYKKVCGAYKWVFPKRRRRKQLLTNSDAAGLAKLKGLVGVGKTMDCWIATHS